MRNGRHTTEFWLTLIVIAISVASFSMADNDWAVFVGMAVVVSVYIYSRKAVKISMINNYYGQHVDGDVVGDDKTEIGDIVESASVAVGDDSGAETNG